MLRLFLTYSYFLGLRTMTVIDHAIESVNKNESIKISYETIPHYDPYVYSDIAKGKTYGVFQLESAGMRGFMNDLYSDVDSRIKKLEKKHKLKGFKNPTGTGDKDEFLKEMRTLGQELFERLIAGISLYRPGPMDYIPDYVAGLKDPDSIEYDDPKLEPILSATYGTIVYQEQVMQIVQTLAGYTLGRADIVRRAMGKKKIDVMEKEKEYFINGKLDKDGNIEVPGCIRNGTSKEAAETIWHKMEDFSKYAFNKSHSAGYALIGTTTAWLKYYYPVDFMAATMNSFVDKQDKLKVYLSVAKSMGIKVLPPDLNKSYSTFSKNGNDIVFGLKAIRNMGTTAKKVVEEREERGPFLDFQDFAERMAMYQTVDKKVLDGAILSGAADNFEGTRKAKISIMDMYLRSAKRKKEEKEKQQVTIFDLFSNARELATIEIPAIEEFEKNYKLEQERHYAGFYVTEHPLDAYEKEFKNHNIAETSGYVVDDEDLEFKVSYDGEKAKMAGIVRELNMYYTKRDSKPLYVFKIEDRTGEIDAVMFSDQIERCGGLSEGDIMIFEGTIKDDDRGLQLIVNNTSTIDTLENNKGIKEMRIKISENDRIDLKRIIESEESGEDSLFVYISGKRYRYADRSINGKSLSLYTKLINRFGKENVKIEYQ